MPFKKFSKIVDTSSRESMIGFLTGHFMYYTGMSWHHAKSFANDVKITHLGLSNKETDALFELIQADDGYESADWLIDEFDREHGWEYQVGFNGRSDGYLVLYRGEVSPTQYMSYCTKCGQRNYTSVADTGTRCGACGLESRVDFDFPPTQKVKLGPVDQDCDYSEWSDEELAERVRLVCDFDRLCDDIITAALEDASNGVEECIEYEPVRKTRKKVANGVDME